MQIECDVNQLLIEMSNEYEHERRLKERQAQIEEEYGLYKAYCCFNGLERNKLSSLNQFMSYCKKNNIRLL